MKFLKIKFSQVINLITISILILTGCQNQEQGLENEIKIPVSVEDIKLKSIEEYIYTTGTVLPTKEVFLKSETSGTYKLLINPKTGKKFAFGDYVEEGQEIIVIEDQEYENNIKIESQKLNLDISKSEYEKQQSLYEKGGVTLRELKNSEREFINAEYAYENALIQLAKLKIKAPFNGTIVDLPYYTPDNKIEMNSEMVKIMDYRNLHLDINLAEKNMNTIKVNQYVRIMNYTLPDDTLIGRITQLSPAIDAETRTFKGTLLINNDDLLLRPGMYIRAEIVVARKDSAIVIPKDIILSKQRGKAVFIVQNGAAQERIISTGLENPDEIEVIRGLNVNERIVIKGFETLSNRAKVDIIR